MDTERWQILLKAIDRGSLRAAAEEMGFTVSGISRSVATLEKELGFSLLYRAKSGVQPTEECRQLLPSVRELLFAQERITTKAGVRYTQITAADVTELIRKQNQLKAENAKLEEANERLRLLFAQIPEIIREEETLAMKLRVHDDIGHSILAARRVLLQHADQKEIRANAALWEQSISVLYRSSQITAQSEPLEAAKKRAEELGVRVLLTGDEPQTQRIRALSALAICECAANCVRHADGTELYVRFWRKPGCTEVALTNNGAAPKEKITEGGGLSMLRQRIKEADGKMEVQSIPRFKLMLSLPEQEEAVYESDDR